MAISWEGYIIRKALHLAGVAVPLVYLLRPEIQENLLLLTLAGATLLLALDICRLLLAGVNRWFIGCLGRFLKEEEHWRVTGSGLFLFSCAMAIIFFSRPVAVASLLFLSLGDLAAAVVGQKWRLAKSRAKSLQGAAACFLVAYLLGGMLVPGPAAFAGALGAGLAELVSGPLGLDDNLSIPMLAGLAMTLMGA